MIRLKEKYVKEVIPAMKEKFGYQNDLAVPKIVKVVVNTGFNPNIKDEKRRQEVAHDLALITGQKTKSSPAKKAISSFKTRQGMIIGLTVTLRGQRMYDFLDRLIHVALPRGRDFHGLAEENIDQAGNLNVGIKEQIIFPEIAAESTKNIFGLEVAVVTSAKNHQQGVALLKLLGFPLK